MSPLFARMQAFGYAKLMKIRVFTGISVSLFMVLCALSGCVKEVGACSEGNQGEVKERIVKAAEFIDVLSDRVIVQESTEYITFPAEWGWVDKPKDFVRPKFIEIEGIHVGSFGWTSEEAETIFQAESYDIVKKLDGTTERRRVPAIKKKTHLGFKFHPITYHIGKSKMPFDKDKMETVTQIYIQKKPNLTIQRDVEFLPDYVTERFDIEHKPSPRVTMSRPTVVGRIREPAEIEEYLEPCEKTAP